MGSLTALPIAEPDLAKPEHHDAGGEAGHEREAGPHGRPDERDSDPWVPVGHPGDRHLQGECEGQDDRHEGQQSGEAEAELVADVRCEDGERGAIEFVDRIEPEQDQQRVERAVAGDRAQPPLLGGRFLA